MRKPSFIQFGKAGTPQLRLCAFPMMLKSHTTNKKSRTYDTSELSITFAMISGADRERIPSLFWLRSPPKKPCDLIGGSNPLPIDTRSALYILSLWLAETGHRSFGSGLEGDPLLGGYLLLICSLFWASDWLRKITWLWSRSGGDPLLGMDPLSGVDPLSGANPLFLA